MRYEPRSVSIVRREIAQQPAVLERLLEGQAGAVAAAAADIRERAPAFVVIAARGSSDNAARYAQHVFGRLCGLPVALATPSLHTVYGTPPRMGDALVLGISQSGASPDVVRVIEDGRRQGAVTVAVTNDPASPMGRAAAHVLELGTGAEESVAATKTYTASLGAVAALAAAIARDADRAAELAAMPAILAAQLELTGDAAPAVARAAAWERLAVAGRGANYATAFEAALKIKELAAVVAEPYSPPDFLHGPIALVAPGYPVLAIAPSGPALAGMRELLKEVRERGAEVVVVSDDASLADPGELLLPLVASPEWLSPLVAVLPAQLLAVGVAEARGVDVDTPFGLSKVTRTT